MGIKKSVGLKENRKLSSMFYLLSSLSSERDAQLKDRKADGLGIGVILRLTNMQDCGHDAWINGWLQ